MTEADWLASEDPAAMLEAVGGTNGDHPDRLVYGQAPRRLSPRKLRLFACGSCRLAWPLLTDPRSRRAVEVAEAVADGRPHDTDSRSSAWQAWAAADALLRPGGADDPAHLAAWHAAGLLTADPAMTARPRFGPHAPPAARAALLRCVAGNPWRPVSRWANPDDHGPWVDDRNPQPWLTPTALALATAAYDERRPDGLLAPDRLAVLADALEDAGCDSADLLGHLRAPGPHARGCWPIDLILGRS